MFPDNLGEVTSIDEVALSDGELYTVVTNAKAKCQKGSLVAMVKGVRSEDVCEILELIPIEQRKQVKEVTLDLAQNMEKIARLCFPEASIVSDRFHVQQLPSEALQEMRIKFRWEPNKPVKKERFTTPRYFLMAIPKNNCSPAAGTCSTNQLVNGPHHKQNEQNCFSELILILKKLMN